MNGAVLRTEKVEANKAATAPKAPEVEGYRFVKWDTDFTKVTKDLLVKPVYEKVAATEKPSTPEKPSMIRNHRIPEIQQMQVSLQHLHCLD